MPEILQNYFLNTSYLVAILTLPVPFFVYRIWKIWRNSWLMLHGFSYLFLGVVYFINQYILTNGIERIWAGFLVRTAVVFLVATAGPMFYALKKDLEGIRNGY